MQNTTSSNPKHIRYRFNEETLQGLLGSSDDEQEDSHASEDQVSKGEDSLADLEGGILRMDCIEALNNSSYCQ